ncbi:MAG: asparagine synthetase B family protein, partial [Bacteroidota bacterium]
KIAFASELKAIESLPKINLSIDRKSIADFLHTGFIPAPNTIYSKIKKLIPGERLVIGKQGIIHTVPFHRIGQDIGKKKISNENQAAEQLDELLSKSVSMQLRSDVPCGIFLSGGIDSSTIAFKAAEVTGRKIDTFTIGNKEVVSDESRFAKKVAAAIGTNHHELIIGESDIIGLIEDGIDTYDEPLADASIIPTLLVSGLACKHVKVVLSGEGADELFMGYGAHKWSRRLRNPVFRYLSSLSIPVLKTLPSRYVRIAELLSLRNSRGYNNHIFSQEQYFFTSREVDILLKKEFSSDTLSQGFRFEQRIQEELYFAGAARDLSPSEEQAFFDLEHYLPDDLLTKIDRATMKHSIEARVPFLDNDLVSFALNLDDKLKIKGGQSKYILKKVLFSHLDQSLFDRPKSGFSIPLVRWLKSDLKYLVEKYLSEEMILKSNLVDPEYVNRLIKEYQSGMHHLFNRIWALVVLHRWMERKGQFAS